MSHGRDLPYDAALPRAQRRARGVYYTPSAVVKYIVGETLTADLWQGDRPPKVLDPACGDGAFLCEVATRILDHCVFRKFSDRQHWAQRAVSVLRRSVFGIDCDTEAIELARRNVAALLLGEKAGQKQVTSLAAKLSGNIIAGDALLGAVPPRWPRTFDAIVGNPPYVNIRQLAKQDTRLVNCYRQRFGCARRGFDLYVLFIERAMELLRAGGRCGLLVPNKLATLDYASHCRAMLVAQTRIETIADLSDLDLFAGASVYPQVVVFQKSSAQPHQKVRIVRPRNGRNAATLRMTPVAIVAQSSLNRRGVLAWDDALDVEDRAPTRTLADFCRLHSGTTGFVAQQIAAELRERCVGVPALAGVRRPAKAGTPTDFPFITSGNIDRYIVRPGNVRFMQRRFDDPVLPQDCPRLTAAKRRLFAGHKIVFSGMSRRLEAAWHEGPLALGVQVFAAADISVDPFYLLAILNSQLLSHLFRTRFPAKRLGGGFLSINKGQLAQLPIVDPGGLGPRQQAIVEQISVLGRQLATRGLDDAADCRVDRLVYRLYRLSSAEISQVERAMPLYARRAA